MTNDRRKRGKQSAEAAAHTRQEIITAATECFSRQGYEATTLRGIAQATGLTHGSLRHHFGSKLDIWRAVADTVLEHYQSHMLPILQDATQMENPLQAFKQVVQSFIRVSYSDPMLARLLMGETATDNERADYVRANFLSLHTPIGLLFERAREQCPWLNQHTNDTFFLALLSLTFFPLIVPGVQQLLDKQPGKAPQQQVERIMGILFGPVHSGP